MSVHIITDAPGNLRAELGLRQANAYVVPVASGQTVADAVKAVAPAFPPGTTLRVVQDTDGTDYTLTVSLTPS